MAQLDEHGQPTARFNDKANLRKATDTLLGICSGIIANHHVSEQEVVFLDTWLRDNEIVIQQWPGNVIAERVREVLADGQVSEEEGQHLLEVLSDITGTDLESGIASGLSAQVNEKTSRVATSMPSEVIFENRTFCFTGKFIYGPRKRLVEATSHRGGLSEDNVTKRVDYLVVGALASRDWAHTSHGRKIGKAMDMLEKGHSITVIEEEIWTSAL